MEGSLTVSEEPKARSWRWLFQLVVSLIIVALLFREVDREALVRIWEGAVPA